MDDMKVPMLNRGSIMWVLIQDVPDRLLKGWLKWELPDPPKEAYYPQYDTVKTSEDERILISGSQDEVKTLLGVLVL